jgi:N-hydroxyarylamine O-acetyltransferase
MSFRTLPVQAVPGSGSTLDRELTDRYLADLGLERAAPSSGLLDAITRRHVARHSFASVGPRLGLELPIDPPSLFRRIVVERRGGYCFEQNGLLFAVLEDLGFEVRPLLARVLLGGNHHPGLTHRISLVTIEGRSHVADVGFGAFGPRGPVAIEGPASGPHRIEELSPGEFHLRIDRDGAPFSLYRFELSRYGEADCELGHFWSHRHPQATFVNHLVAARILDNEVRSLRNREYRVIRASGESREEIAAAGRLQGILRDEFGLEVSTSEAERLFAGLP